MIDISDLSDSREVMMQKTPRAISWFILTVVIIVLAALIFSCFGKIETHIKATGEIRPMEPISSITSICSGKITDFTVSDGELVKKGDIILSLDSSPYVEQKNTVESQMSAKKSQIDNYKKLNDCIKNDKNIFDEQIEPIFFYQYKSYEKEIDSAWLQSESSNQQIAASRKEVEQIISDAEKAISIATASHSEYSEFYDIVQNDKIYSGNNGAIIVLYDNYVISSDKAEAVYNGYLAQYNEVCRQYQEAPELINYSQVEQALFNKDAAYADLLSVKSNFLLQLNEVLNDLEQQIVSNQNTIKNYTLKKESLIIDTSFENVKAQIKESYYLNINNTINTLNLEIENLSEQLKNVQLSISQTSLTAEKDGVLIYSREYSAGDVISAGELICTIVPATDEYRVVMYIPEYSISETFVGQEVEYVIAAAPNIDFGKIYGVITEISQDSFVDQASGQKYYKALATLPCAKLTDKDGQERNLKNGMLVEIHAITGHKKIITWILEKLNFI